MSESPAAPVIAQLSQWGTQPGTDARNRRPDMPSIVDAVDRLVLTEAAATLATMGGADVAVIDDRYGALTFGASSLASAPSPFAPVRIFQDTIDDEHALAAVAQRLGWAQSYVHCALGADLLAGARVVLLRLPRSLAALREYAEQIAAHARDDAVVFAGGRVKHMTLAMNEVLRESFEQVSATRAAGKSRVLIARRPRAITLGEPAHVYVPDAGLTVCAYGGAFAGVRLDVGTRFLVEQLDVARPATPVTSGPPTGSRQPALLPPDASQVVDLGCGTGILAAWAAKHWPSAQVVATDRSDSAVRSAAATAKANDVGDQVVTCRDDVGASLAAASYDVVLCNPPFHDGPALSTDAAHRMFGAAARVLRVGGQLWCVWNSHLRYRPALERMVGPTVQVARNPKFTVTCSTRRSP